MYALPDDWTKKQNALYRKVYDFMLANQQTAQHPQAAAMPEEHWNTIAHNAAYAAAELLVYDEFRIKA